MKVMKRVVASISRIKSALNFFVHAILICYYGFQVFELCHIIRGLISSQ
jgi:hypothetical protein